MPADLLGSETDRLKALAAGLCQDASIDVEVHDSHDWAWDSARRVILASASDVRDRGHFWCAAILAHEVSHFFISRYPLFDLATESEAAVAVVLNAIEDPRANRWIQQRYPGTREWYRVLQSPDSTPRAWLPLYLSFCFACAAEPGCEWTTTPDALMEDAVLGALERTRGARREYAETAPRPDLAVADPTATVASRYRQKVWPRLRPEHRRVVPTTPEQDIRWQALVALDLAGPSIIPEALALLDTDCERLARLLGRNAELRSMATLAVRRRDHRIATAIVTIDPRGVSEATPAPADLRLARALLELVIERIGGAPADSADSDGSQTRPVSKPLVTDTAPRVPASPATSPRSGSTPSHKPAMRPLSRPTPYERALDELGSQVEELAARVEAVLRPRRRLRSRAGYPSGSRVSLPRLMRFEADPRRYDDLWFRDSLPERRDAAVLLLVDLSGSMRGANIRAAHLGTVLLAETCARLGVPCGVFGFQDELIPFVEIGDPLDEAARAALESLPREVDGERKGGHNHPAHNDDGPCLLEAAERLKARHERDRLLLVISDGRPEGRRSTSEDLHRAVAALTRAPAELDLVALGLGPGTDHVQEYYPDAVANVPVREFAHRFGALLEQVLTGGAPTAIGGAAP